MSAKKPMNTQRINVFFAPDIIDELKRLATERGTSVSGLVRMIVLEYLAKK